MRRGLVRLALAAAFGVWLVGVGPVRSADPGPERFVTELAVGIATVLRDASVDEGRRLAHVDTLTAGAFDLERSARIALGRHWRSAAEEERREFAELFRFIRDQNIKNVVAASINMPTARSVSPAGRQPTTAPWWRVTSRAGPRQSGSTGGWLPRKQAGGCSMSRSRG